MYTVPHAVVLSARQGVTALVSTTERIVVLHSWYRNFHPDLKFNFGRTSLTM